MSSLASEGSPKIPDELHQSPSPAAEERMEDGEEEAEGKEDEEEHEQGEEDAKEPRSKMSFPFATVHKILKSQCPSTRFKPEFVRLLSKCSCVFGVFILCQAAKGARKAKRALVSTEDVFEALKSSGLEALAAEAEGFLPLHDLKKRRR